MDTIVLKDLKTKRISKVVKSLIEEKNIKQLNNKDIISTITENVLVAVEWKGWDIVDAIHHYMELEFFKVNNKINPEEFLNDDFDLEII